MAAGEPLVTLLVASSSGATYVNNDEKVKFEGIVDAEAFCTTAWSINTDSGIVLESSADTGNMLTPVTTTIGSGRQSIFFALKPSVLSQGSKFTFTLTTTMTGGGASSSASIDIETNGPPLPGLFSVTPSVGTELVTEFTLSASLWLDQDLPISYSFFYVEPASSKTETSISIIQSRSETSYGVSKLPAGFADQDDSAIVTGVQVYDNLNAMSIQNQNVKCTTLHVSTIELATLIKNQIAQSGGNINARKQALAISGSTMNVVDCTAAPNCTSINRQRCMMKEHTCGECDIGYMAADGSGPDNSPCVSSSLISTMFNRTSSTIVATSCSTDSDCDSFASCDLITSQCKTEKKNCPANCNGHGFCSYIDANTDEQLFTCSQGDAKCHAFCTCDAGYGGSSCGISEQALGEKAKVRSELIDSLETLMSGEDASVESIIGWVKVLSSLTQNSDQLSASSLTKVSNLVEKALLTIDNSATSVPYSSVKKILAVTDKLVGLKKVATITTSSNRKRKLVFTNNRRLDEIDRTKLTSVQNNALEKMGNFILKDMVVGQSSIDVVEDNFRMTTIAQSLSSSSGSGEIKAPMSDFEKLADVAAPFMTMPLSSSSSSSSSGGSSGNDGVLKMTLAVLPSKNYNASAIMPNANTSTISAATGQELQSEIVSSGLKLTLDCDLLQNTQTQYVKFTIPFNKKQNLGVGDMVSSTNFTTSCRRKHIESFHYYCPDTDETLTVQCDGIKKEIFTKCPVMEKVSKCHSPSLGPDSSSTSSQSCTVVESESDSTKTTCSCAVCTPGAANVSARRLQNSNGNNEVREVAAMTEYSAKQFAAVTSTAAGYNSAEVIAGTIRIIFCFAFIWIGLPLAGWAIMRLTLIYNSVTSDKKREEKEKEQRSQGFIEQFGAQSEVIEKFTEYINTIIPPLYDTKSSKFTKLWNEAMGNHPYFCILREPDTFKRTIKTAHILTELTVLCFLLAVLFDLQFPSDDGTCETLVTDVACQGSTSPFDSSQHTCQWDVEYMECNYLPYTVSVSQYLLMTVLLSVLLVPFQVLVDFIFVRILLAPTARDIDKNHAASNGVVSHTARRIRATARRASNAMVTAAKDAGRRMSAFGNNIVGKKTEKTKAFTSAAMVNADQAKALRDANSTLSHSTLAQMQLNQAKLKYTSLGGTSMSNNHKNNNNNDNISGTPKVLGLGQEDAELNKTYLKNNNYQNDKNVLAMETEDRVKSFRIALLKHRNSLRVAETVTEFDEQWGLTMINGGNYQNTQQMKAGPRYFFSTKAESVMNQSISSTLCHSHADIARLKDMPPSLRGTYERERIVRVFLTRFWPVQILGGKGRVG